MDFELFFYIFVYTLLISFLFSYNKDADFWKGGKMVRRSSKKLTKKQERIRHVFESERTVEVISSCAEC